MEAGYCTLKNSSVYYCRWGTGPQLVIAFHGYGESSASFAFVGEALPEEYTLLAIDLPFHGKTEWKEGRCFSPEDLRTLLEIIVARIPGITDGWRLAGYSMGGRVALQLLEIMPEKIRRLVLLAPDGVKVNGWYWLATRTGPGNGLFRWTMRRPGWLFFLLRAGNALRLVNPSVYKFTAHYIADDRVRQDLYTRWTSMRDFRPTLSKVKKIIRSQHLPVRLLYGRHDRIIRWENGDRFCKDIGPSCQLTLLPSGHQLLQPSHLDAILLAIGAVGEPPLR
ncbi:MAG TPA: alpha/beta hydrolase [Puia sp.]|jgi:pimeloyl-ACP methyl ester carboxylesterase